MRRVWPRASARGSHVLPLVRSSFCRQAVMVGDAGEDGEEQYETFLRLAPSFECEIVRNGIILLKYFLAVSQDEQRRRFEARITDPLKHWKLSPMDTESVRCWWDYTIAYQRMLETTDTPDAPWYVVPADDKRRARLNLIHHMLSQIPYQKIKPDLPEIPKAQPRPKDVREEPAAGHIIPSQY